MPPTTRPTTSRSVAALLMALCIAVLSGCLRYTESLTIKADDTVSGIVVIAARKPGSDGPATAPTPAPGQTLPTPVSDSPDIEVSTFEHAQESGYRVVFRDASFADVSSFAPLGDKGGALKIKRSGDTLSIEMSIDLTYAASAEDLQYFKDTAKASVTLTVPGTVKSSNGKVTGDTITWQLAPLELNTISASIESPKGTAQAGGARSIDPLRAAILGAGLLALACGGWLLLRRLRSRTAPAATAPTLDTVQPRRTPPPRPTRTAPEASFTPPDPFGDSETPVPHAAPTAPDRVRPTPSEPPAGTQIAGGGWPPPQPRWKENR